MQSLLAYTPGIRAGLIIGAIAPYPYWGLTPLNPNKVKYKVYQQFGAYVNAVDDNHIFLILSIILVIGSSLFEPIIISAAAFTSS